MTGSRGRAAIAASIVLFLIVSAFVFNLARFLLRFLQPQTPDLVQYGYLLLLGFAGGLLVMISLGNAFRGKHTMPAEFVESISTVSSEEPKPGS